MAETELDKDIAVLEEVLAEKRALRAEREVLLRQTRLEQANAGLAETGSATLDALKTGDRSAVEKLKEQARIFNAQLSA